MGIYKKNLLLSFRPYNNFLLYISKIKSFYLYKIKYKRKWYLINYFIALFYNNIISIFSHIQPAQKNEISKINTILLIYSKQHFDPTFDSPTRKLAFNSASNLARNIYESFKDKKIIYVDQKEKIVIHENVDLIISIPTTNFWFYEKQFRKAKKIIFLVNAHPLYRLRVLLEESKRYKKHIPKQEYISPFTLINFRLVKNRFILIGNQFVRDTHQQYGIPIPQENLIQSGVNIDMLKPQPSLRPKNKIRIVYFASDIGLRKGLFRVIQLWNEIKNTEEKLLDEMELLIVGGCNFFLDELKNFIKKYNNIYYLGWIDSTDIKYKEILQSAHIILNLSLEEGQVGCVLEGMACGCIPIISRQSGIDIVNQRNGFMLESFENIPLTKEYIKILIKNPDMMEQISKNARNSVETDHNWKKFRSDFRNLVLG